MAIHLRHAVRSMSNNLSHLPIAVLPLCGTHSRIREARSIELIPQKRGRHVASLHPCINLIGRQQEAAQISLTKTRECDRNYVGLIPPSNRHNAAVMPYQCPHVHSRYSYVCTVGFTWCRSIPHAAKRGAVSVDRSMISFYCRLSPRLPRV